MIETERLVLRRLLARDDHDVYRYMSDPSVTECLAKKRMSRQDVTRFISDEDDALAIVLKETGQVVGHTVVRQAIDSHSCQLSWVINRQFHRQGSAYEAGEALLKYAFDTLRIDRVSASAQSCNLAGCALLRKLGMVYEGYFRQCISKSNGVWWGTHAYIMLKADYCRHIAMADRSNPKVKWLHNILVGLDQLGNSLAGGEPSTTISARVGYFANVRREGRSRPYWKVVEGVIDWAFYPLEGAKHCVRVYQNDTCNGHINGNDVIKAMMGGVIVPVCVVIALGTWGLYLLGVRPSSLS
ncbi:GNAT family N-acetyltransferase [Vibrio ouci]|uniref:N-acetyltransferase n=1 Tax=Vibrio ouci TaxID=2499078 RepID=A0A4Y8WBH7_9VIBR|nr:GNAT family protein [Vibrio ouci]TFH90300.1 N-acetyltransferase [Vibrio ouci]